MVKKISLIQVKNLSPGAKFGLVLSSDIFVSVCANWFAYTLRLESWHIPNQNQLFTYLFAAFSFIPVFYFLGIYRNFNRYISIDMLKVTLAAIVVYCGFYFSCLWFFQFPTVPRSIGLLQPMIFLVLICSVRVLIGSVELSANHLQNQRILLYGAGAAGSEVISALALSKREKVVALIDDDKKKQGRQLLGIKIFGPHEIGRLISKFGVTDILLAMPSISKLTRNEIIDKLLVFNIRVRSIPTMSELLSNTSDFARLVSLDPEEFLPRKPLQMKGTLKGLQGKVVLVTGAGGSIGGQICRMLVDEKINTLIMVEHSEFGLYKIQMDIESLLRNKKLNIDVIPILADVCDELGIKRVFQRLKPQVVYHGAAYKHVPMAETNSTTVVRNNFMATRKLTASAMQFNVEKFILISTDKAVRSTNIMGASKRLAEMSVQAAASLSSTTIFTMVRFGNVVGSSGSAIPLFQSQIENGGPVTVTDPNVTRYFMSISEAVKLVLEAGEMATGGEVFVFDMGDPVKVVDVVRRMIRLNGKVEKLQENDSGDIEIRFIGLRPGEKMFEELVLGSALKPTTNPQIFRAEEPFASNEDLDYLEREIIKLTESDDYVPLKKILFEFGVLIK